MSGPITVHMRTDVDNQLIDRKTNQMWPRFAPTLPTTDDDYNNNNNNNGGGGGLVSWELTLASLHPWAMSLKYPLKVLWSCF